MRHSDQPMVYLVLSRDIMASPGDAVTTNGDSLTAAVLTAGTPIAAAYRGVQRISMRRTSDNAEFDWAVLPVSGTFRTTSSDVGMAEIGNLRLPWTGTGGRLGRSDLQDGETYTLDISSDGQVIHGQATLPATPILEHIVVGGKDAVMWHPVAGAAYYVVDAETDQSGAASTTDTVYVLRHDQAPGAVPAAPRLTVTVFDQNLYRYWSDTLSASAGLQGASGVFGALNQATILVPR